MYSSANSSHTSTVNGYMPRPTDRLQGEFTRIVNISGLDVKGRDKGDSSNTITATCVATTFVLLDKPAAKAGARGAAPGTATPPAGRGGN